MVSKGCGQADGFSCRRPFIGGNGTEPGRFMMPVHRGIHFTPHIFYLIIRCIQLYVVISDGGKVQQRPIPAKIKILIWFATYLIPYVLGITKIISMLYP